MHVYCESWNIDVNVALTKVVFWKGTKSFNIKNWFYDNNQSRLLIALIIYYLFYNTEF